MVTELAKLKLEAVNGWVLHQEKLGAPRLTVVNVIYQVVAASKLIYRVSENAEKLGSSSSRSTVIVFSYSA